MCKPAIHVLKAVFTRLVRQNAFASVATLRVAVFFFFFFFFLRIHYRLMTLTHRMTLILICSVYIACIINRLVFYIGLTGVVNKIRKCGSEKIASTTFTTFFFFNFLPGCSFKCYHLFSHEAQGRNVPNRVTVGMGFIAHMFRAAHKQWKVAILILINTSAPIKFRIVEMETD